ncbi:MAG: hypothetical protein ACRDTM_06205 [Micromonosporaceae bacterium]
MNAPLSGYELAELRRRIDHLVAIAETLAHQDPRREAPSPGLELLYAEVEQLAAVVQGPSRPEASGPVRPPRQRGSGAVPGSTYPADYWFG